MKKENNDKLDDNLTMLAKSSIIVFFGIALSKIITYIYKIIIARQFGPETYGLFSLAIMTMSFFIMFFSLGFNEGLLRFASFYRGKDETGKISHVYKYVLRTLVLSGLFGGILLFLLSNFIAVDLFHNDKLTLYLRILSIALPFAILSSTYLSALLAFEKVAWNTFINNVFQNLMKVIVLLLLMWAGLNGNAVILSYFMGLILMFIVTYVVSKRYLAKIYGDFAMQRKTFDKLRKDLIAYSWPIILLGAIYTLFDAGDSVVIGYFIDASAVGIYNAAFTILALFGIAPELFKQLFFPLIVKEYSRKKLRLISELSKQTVKWVFILNVPLFLIIFVFPGAILNIIFGPEYLEVAGVLRVLAVGGLLASSTTVLNNLLSMKGKTKLILTNIIVISSIDFIANILLVPRFGLYGAAYSTAIGLAVLNIVLAIQVYQNLKMFPFRKKLINISIMSLLSLGILLYVRAHLAITTFSLFIMLALFGLLYLFLLFATKCFDKNDIAILNLIKSKLNINKESNGQNLQRHKH